MRSPPSIAAERGALTQAVENIIEANTLLSGLGFENCGVSGGHGIHDGLTVLDETHGFYPRREGRLRDPLPPDAGRTALAEIEETARFCRSAWPADDARGSQARQGEPRGHRARGGSGARRPVPPPGARPRRFRLRLSATRSLRWTALPPRSPPPPDDFIFHLIGTSSMQAAVMYKPGDIRLEEVPKPDG